MEADANFVYSADSVKTCDDWYTNCLFFAIWLFLTVFDDWYTVVGTVLVDLWRLLHQQCTSCQNSKNDHWSNKTVPTVYQSSKQSKTVKQQKMTIGVPIVTCLHRVRRIHKVCVRRPRPCPRPLNTQSHSCISWTPLSQDVRLSVSLCVIMYVRHRHTPVLYRNG